MHGTNIAKSDCDMLMDGLFDEFFCDANDGTTSVPDSNTRKIRVL